MSAVSETKGGELFKSVRPEFPAQGKVILFLSSIAFGLIYVPSLVEDMYGSFFFFFQPLVITRLTPEKHTVQRVENKKQQRASDEEGKTPFPSSWQDFQRRPARHAPL